VEMMENFPSRIKVDYLHIQTTQFGKRLSTGQTLNIGVVSDHLTGNEAFREL